MVDLPLRNILHKQICLLSCWKRKHFIGKKSYRVYVCVYIRMYEKVDPIHLGTLNKVYQLPKRKWLRASRRTRRTGKVRNFWHTFVL